VISDRLADELERSASSSTHRRALPARTQPRVRNPDLNDPQILLLELAHGMLVDTETYIDCPYRYWPVAQVPRYGPPAGRHPMHRTPSVPAASWLSVLVDANGRGELEVIKKR